MKSSSIASEASQCEIHHYNKTVKLALQIHIPLNSPPNISKWCCIWILGCLEAFDVFTSERKTIVKEFKPVRKVQFNVKHHWCDWVDLNTDALIISFIKDDDSAHSLHSGRQGLVVAACSCPHLWFRHNCGTTRINREKKIQSFCQHLLPWLASVSKTDKNNIN